MCGYTILNEVHVCYREKYKFLLLEIQVVFGFLSSKPIKFGFNLKEDANNTTTRMVDNWTLGSRDILI